MPCALPAQTVSLTITQHMRRRPERNEEARGLNDRLLCLVLSLRVLGFPVVVPDDLHGPLFALLDGNRLLEPFRARMYRVVLEEEELFLQDGLYILGYLQHCMPMRVFQARRVQFPTKCAVFRIITGPRRLQFDNILDSVTAYEESLLNLRHDLGLCAGRVTFNRLLGFDDLAMSLSHVLQALLEVEGNWISWAQRLRRHLLDYRGGGRRDDKVDNVRSVDDVAEEETLPGVPPLAHFDQEDFDEFDLFGSGDEQPFVDPQHHSHGELSAWPEPPRGGILTPPYATARDSPKRG